MDTAAGEPAARVRGEERGRVSVPRGPRFPEGLFSPRLRFSSAPPASQGLGKTAKARHRALHATGVTGTETQTEHHQVR